MTTVLFLVGFLLLLGAYHLADRRARRATDRAEKADRFAAGLAGDLLAAQSSIRALRSANTALIAEAGVRDAVARTARRRHPRVAVLAAEDIAFLRLEWADLAVYLGDCGEPEDDEQRARRRRLERRLLLLQRLIGSPS
jgi:hypothetical protein